MTVYEYGIVKTNLKTNKWEAAHGMFSDSFKTKIEAFNHLGTHGLRHYDTNSIGEYFFIKEVQHDIG